MSCNYDDSIYLLCSCCDICCDIRQDYSDACRIYNKVAVMPLGYKNNILTACYKNLIIFMILFFVQNIMCFLNYI